MVTVTVFTVVDNDGVLGAGAPSFMPASLLQPVQ